MSKTSHQKIPSSIKQSLRLGSVSLPKPLRLLSPAQSRCCVMGKPRPGGGECARGCGATHSSNWFGKAPDKVCRACYGKATQRKGSQQVELQTEVRRGSPSSVTATAELASIGRGLESWQDLEASVKTVLLVLGCR